MPTKEQRKASAGIMKAVTALNEALSEAGRVCLFVELRLNAGAGGRNGAYYVDKIETRETVLPS
ncbi:hypothetical protein MA20_12855 [Bradyrhizobium japonicum]|uniref:Uncharacterized protein n=1 Tax=Bradyrhizobium japonicum TaxID=375 RepID=A0A0A3Z073_BRAJP|nr:hypothetical protein [Bradyrhizobium japonicum]KGT79303.1 hypothetical protein MA20_12855 [Bradyrhizobium japonicum]